MNISSEVYNSVNGGQIRDAVETINLIKSDIGENVNVGIIADVGCGSGNVSRLMAQAIPHDRIISFDVAPDMVETNRQLNSDDPTFEFLVQDISLPWEELNPQLRQLEGKVDLVWSNRVLHWVVDDARAVANIVRLLKPGGRVYINITLIPDFNEFLPPAEKEAQEKIVKLPSLKYQHENWTKCFQQAGLPDVNVQFVEKVWEYATHEQFLSYKNCTQLIRRFLVGPLTREEEEKTLEKLGDIFLRGFATPQGQPVIESFEGVRTCHYGQFQVTGVKP